MNTFAYVGGNPLTWSDTLGLATQAEIDIAIGLIFSNFPEIFTVKPNSVKPVKNLSSTFGLPIQGVTTPFDDIKITENIFGNSNTQVDEFLQSEFLQVLAHELLHVQQGLIERLLTVGELHDQIDSNAAIISETILSKFKDCLK